MSDPKSVPEQYKHRRHCMVRAVPVGSPGCSCGDATPAPAETVEQQARQFLLKNVIVMESYCNDRAEIKLKGKYVRSTLAHILADFARQVRKETVREFKPYIRHKWTCSVRKVDNPATEEDQPCTCGLDALRARFGVREG